MQSLRVARILVVLFSAVAAAQTQTTARPIRPPDQPFPTEQDSAGITRFSFIAYGDSRCDCGNGGGPEIQIEHERVVDLAIAKAAALASTPYPARFVVQSGDAVYRGMAAERWNDTFIPIVEKLTKSGLSYFLAVGN